MTSIDVINQVINMAEARAEGSAENAHENVIKDFKNKLRNKLDPAIAANWRSFGIQLIGYDNTTSIPPPQTKTCANCFEELIAHFLSSERKWEEIFIALEGIHKINLSNKLKKTYRPDQTVNLNVSQLVNKLEDISSDWNLFGIHLCIEKNKLDCIKQPATNRELLHDVLDYWYDVCGDPIESIDELCKSLVFIEKKRLAEEVRQLADSYPSYRVIGVDDNKVSQVTQDGESQNVIDEENELSARLERLRASDTSDEEEQTRTSN